MPVAYFPSVSYTYSFLNMSLPSFTEKSQAAVSESQHLQLQLNSYILSMFRVIPLTPDLTQTSFSLSLERLTLNGATTVLYRFRASLCFPCYTLQLRTRNTSSICDSTHCMPVIIQSEEACPGALFCTS